MGIIAFLRAKLKKYDDEHNFTCNICGREVFGGEWICAVCDARLPRNNAIVCPLCGRRVREEGICLECKQKPLTVSKARSAFLHEDEAARLVVRFKRGEKYLYRTLAAQLLPLLEREFPRADALTFVPMTERAERKRGYNQARLLAEELSARSGVPFIAPAVKRKETSSQKFLTRADREKNLEHVFHVEDRAAVKGKHIVIVDDTLTTGATVSELGGALKRAGAKEVYALTFTSVENKFPFGKPQ